MFPFQYGKGFLCIEIRVEVVMKKYNILSAVKLCFKYAPFATTVNIMLNVLNGLLPMLMVYIVASFIDSAVKIVTDNSYIMIAAGSAVVLVLCYLYTELSQVFQRLASKGIEFNLRLKLRPLMIKKQASIDFALIEEANTLDLISFVTEQTESRFIGILNDFSQALRLLIQTVGVMIILGSYVWWLPLAFIFGSVPLVIISYRGGAAVVDKDREVTVLTRMMYYLSDVLSGREAAAERTLFGFSRGVNKRFEALHRKRSDLNTELIARWEFRAKMCGISLNVFVLVAMIALAGDLLNGVMSTGGYIAVVGAMISTSRLLAGSLSKFVFNISGHIGFMKSYEMFWGLSDDESLLTYVPVKVSFERLEINNLWFKYKQTDDYILKGLTLTIEKGKSYSLIGQNGAGKTTLTKILTGLYRDFEGEIFINGKDIKKYSVNELRSFFAVIYQDFGKYYVSIKDNITLGGGAGNLGDLLRSTELEDVAAKLPLGVDTPLGKILDGGMDVSGGEWQKIAIARGIHRNCPFIILDEPTASLSPMMESKIYHQFADISTNHTPLLISHRLGSTKISDVLFVLHGGKVIETGSHAELMDNNGLYAEMFESQKGWYDDSIADH